MGGGAPGLSGTTWQGLYLDPGFSATSSEPFPDPSLSLYQFTTPLWFTTTVCRAVQEDSVQGGGPKRKANEGQAAAIAVGVGRRVCVCVCGGLAMGHPGCRGCSPLSPGDTCPVLTQLLKFPR